MDIKNNLPNPGFIKPLDFRFFETPEKNEFFIFHDKNHNFLEEQEAQYFNSNFSNSNFKLDTLEDEENNLQKLYLISNLKSNRGINLQSNKANIENNHKEEIMIRQQILDEKRELIERKKIFLIKKIKYKNMGITEIYSIHPTKDHH